MRASASYDIVQRETFALELALLDETGTPENIAGNVVTVECSAPLDATDFDVSETNFATGEILITADTADTLVWPIGRHLLRVWIRYILPDPIEREVLLTVDLCVEPRI